MEHESFGYADRMWNVNPKCRRRRSGNGINLVFVPGQNVVLELNVVAGEILELFENGAGAYAEVCESLRRTYDVDDEPMFELEVQQLLERLITHRVLVEAEGVTP